MDIKDVENLAKLARIEIKEAEKREILKEIKSILDYVKIIEKTETGDSAPLFDLKNVWREDRLEPREFSRESILGQFPAAKENFLKVKKILQ